MFPEHIFEILALCILLAAGSGGVLIWLGGPVAGPRWAELGIGVGFLAGFVALAEGLPLIDDVANPALGESALGIVAAAALITLLRIRGRLTVWVAAAVCIGIAAWVLAGPGFVIVQTGTLVELILLIIASFCLVFRLQAMASDGVLPLCVLIVIGLGMMGVALIDHAATLAALDLAYVAAILGASIWMWPLRRWTLGAAGLALGTGLIMGLAAAFIRNTAAPPWGLLPLCGCFFADQLLAFLPRSKKRRRKKAPRPFLLAIAVLAPAVLGVVLSALLAAMG